MVKNLDLEKPIAILDVETTGKDRNTAKIVEIAILKAHPDGTEEFKAKRINPGILIPSRATVVHGITDDDVKDAPRFVDYAKGIASFLNGCDLCGCNIEYDLQVLESEFKNAGVEFSRDDRSIIDCLTIFRKKEGHTLEAAYRKYCGKELINAHSAESDVRATLEILESQLEIYDDLPRDVVGLCGACDERDEDSVDKDGKLIWEEREATFDFGKYRGRTLKDVASTDSDYLHWLITNASNLSREVKDILEDVLKGEFPIRG